MKAISQHLSSAQVADLLDERLDPGDRDAVIAHLATCSECRHEVADLHGALSRVGGRRPRTRWMAGAAIAAAAVVAFMAVPRLTTRPATPRENSATRTAEPSPIEAAARLRVVEPSDGEVFSSAAAFTWRSAGAGASYLLTVQDGAGTVMWTTTATDTSAVLPANVRLAAGVRYFWSVDARLGDGSSSRSGAHSFTAR